MLTLLAVIHLLVGGFLIVFVLLQDPKGGAMGVFSGGGSGSQSFFGSSGASNILTTVTKWLAILFACSCLVLTYMTTRKGGSVMDSYAPPATAPAAPEATPGATAPGKQTDETLGTEPATAPAAPKSAPTNP